MKRPFVRLMTLTALAAMTVGVVGCGKNGDSEKSDAPANSSAITDAKPKVVLSQGRMTIDGKPAPLPGELAEWEALLGPTSRREALAASTKEPAVNVYIWDQQGIVAVERPDLAQITKVTLAIEPPEKSSASDGAAELVPFKRFPGSLTIDGVRVDVSSTPLKLNTELGGLQFAQLKRFPHSWNLAYGAWTITAITDVKGERLVEVAIGE
jgi:hypothetical protein